MKNQKIIMLPTLQRFNAKVLIRLLTVIILFNFISIKCEIEEISETEFYSLKKSLIQFAKTESLQFPDESTNLIQPIEAPKKLSSFIKPGRTLIAQIDEFYENKYYCFQTEDDAKKIQEMIFSGMTITWYYHKESCCDCVVS